MADEEKKPLKEEPDIDIEDQKKNNENNESNQIRSKKVSLNVPGNTEKQDELSQEEDQCSQQAVGPYTIPKRLLTNIFHSYQGRTFQEEIQIIEKYGGLNWMQKGLRTDIKNGIKGDEQDLNQRNKAFGSNKRDEVEQKGLFSFLCEALDDFTLKLLLVASILSILIKTWTAPNSEKRSTSWIEGFAIFVSVCICAFVTAINNYQKEKQFQQLNKVANQKKIVSVVRNGVILDVHQSEIVVGDLLIIREGMNIPADGIVVEGSEITTDESAMTGETEPLHKDTIQNIENQKTQHKLPNQGNRHDGVSPVMMSGTQVVTGEGKMLVLVVGYSSCSGKIQLILKSQEEDDQTPLQVKLEELATELSVIGLVCSCIIVLSLLVRFSIERTMENSWNDLSHLHNILDYLIIGIALLVMAIPEGLPLAVTISLAYSVKRMIQDQILVRKLQACETMGGANIICSDKTGTLTTNQMTLVQLWNDKLIDLQPYNQVQKIADYIPEQLQELFLQSTICNSSALLQPSEKGSRTEIAILRFADKAQIDVEEYRNKFEVAKKIPFNSQRKRMSVILKTQNGQILHVKGASELILNNCTHFHNFTTNQVEEINQESKDKIQLNIELMAKKALRTICIAYKKIDENENLEEKDKKGIYQFEQTNLTLLGVLGIKDIVRPEVPSAVEKCQNAGIKVIMITGDNKDTAEAIAKDCNIISQTDQEYKVIEGTEFHQLTGGIVCKFCRTFECDCPRDEETSRNLNRQIRIDTIQNSDEFDRLIPLLRVMARSRPEDKYALVAGLIERGNVVAVTGDGTNDAPALKKADVGLAMGIQGTEVAREAASIILLDDNFKSIVQAVLWGRNIYDSISKFLQFQLTVTFVAVVTTIVTATLIQMETLEPIQMLWINLIMDSLAALALATEKPYDELLKRKPQSRNDSLITRKMLKHIIGQGIFQSILILIFIFAGHNFLPEFGDQFDTRLLNKCRTAQGTYDCQNAVETWFLAKELRYVNWWEFKYSQEPKSTVTLTNDNINEYVDNLQGYIKSGILESFDQLTDLYQKTVLEFDVPSRHFTYIFNLFVFLSVFNFFNVRKLKIFDNYLFLTIVAAIVFCQIVIVTFGSHAFNLYNYGGLTFQQWLVTILYASLVLLFGLILRLCPDCGKSAQPDQPAINSDDQGQNQVLEVKEKKNE